MNDLFRDYLAERILVLDGAMGTRIQAATLSLDDFENASGSIAEAPAPGA